VRKFELTKPQAVGTHFSSLLAVKDYDLVFTDSNLAKQDGLMNKRIQTTGIRNGKPFPIELAITPVQVDDATIFTAFVRDLTDQKRLETDLAHAQKMESIGQLAAGVAHEINTPNQYIGDNLTFIKDSFGAIRKAVDPLLQNTGDETLDQNNMDLLFAIKEIPNAIREALEGVQRVGSIVKAMKDFSHPGQEERTAVDLNRVINSTVAVARNEWKYNCRIDLNLEEDLPTIEGDACELGQVFLNLLINSVHAIKERFQSEPLGVISISTSSMGDSVEVTLSDNGCGIPEGAITRVFDPFFTTKPIGQGTGQGLAITHAVIVHGHHGNISFSTKAGEGTSFFIRLPVGSRGELAA
jgi:signal transduction histidine kinase